MTQFNIWSYGWDCVIFLWVQLTFNLAVVKQIQLWYAVHLLRIQSNLYGSSSTYEDKVGVSEALTWILLYILCILLYIQTLCIMYIWGHCWVAGVSEAVTNLGHEAATGALGPPCVSQSAYEYQNTRTQTNIKTEGHKKISKHNDTRNRREETHKHNKASQTCVFKQLIFSAICICLTQKDTFKKHINICSKICIPVSTHDETHKKRFSKHSSQVTLE